MPNIRMVFVAVLGVLPGALPSSELAAQRLAPPSSLESFWSHMRLEAVPPQARADGLGARVGWIFAESTHPVLARTELGLHGVHAPPRAVQNSLRVSATTIGIGADARLFDRPLIGRVDPLVSLGAGVLRTRLLRAGPTSPAPFIERTETTVTLTPGVGALLHLDRRLSARVDLRHGFGERHVMRTVGMRFSL